MPQGSDLVTIRHEAFEVALAPRVGGGVASFRFAGVDILRPASDAALDAGTPTDLAAFPLFPFAGRIARGRFRFADRDIRLEPNLPPEPHAIHGRAWQNPWSLEQETSASATMVYESARAGVFDDWPWSYRATQRFALGEAGMTLSLSITNLADEAMPAGLGWHPYFRRADARVFADVERVWRSEDDTIPTGPSGLDPSNDLRSLRRVSHLALDHAFDVGRGHSEIVWPEAGIRATLGASPPLRHLVVYAPTGEDFFCVEPVSHAPDAVRSELAPERTGYRELEGGETFEAEITLGVESIP